MFRILVAAFALTTAVVVVPATVEATAGNCTWGTGYHTDWIPPFDSYGTMWGKCTTGNTNDRWYMTWTCGLNGGTSITAQVTIGAYAPSTIKRTARCPTNHSVVSGVRLVKYTV